MAFEDEASNAEIQGDRGNSDSNPNVSPELSAGSPPQTGQPEDSSLQMSQQPMQQTGLQSRPQQHQQPQPQQPQPSIQHPQSELFNRFFEGMVGGARMKPVMDADGKPTGEVQMIHPTKGGMAAGIVAGALSGMMAGMAAKPNEDKFGNKSYGPSMAAGADAMKEQQRKQRFQDLDMSEEQQKYAYNTTKTNLDALRQGFDVYKQQGEVMDGMVQTHAAIYQGALAAGFTPDPKMSGLTGDQVRAMMNDKSFNVAADNVLATGTRDVRDANGNVRTIPGTKLPMREVLYTVVDPQQIVENNAELTKYFPQLKGVKNLPLRQVLQMAGEAHDATSAQGVADEATRQLNELFKGKKFDPVDIKKLMEQDPTLKRDLKNFGTHHGQSPDEMLAELDKKGVNIGSFAAALLQGKVSRKDITDAQAAKASEEKKTADNKAALDLKKAEDEYENSTPAGRAKLAHTLAETRTANMNADEKEQTQKGIDVIANKLVNDPYNLMTMRDIGGRGAQKIEILARAEEIANQSGKYFDSGLALHRLKFLDEYEDPKGKAALNNNALSNLMNHASRLQDASNANGRLPVKFLNTPLNKIKDQFGVQTYTNYQTVLGVLKEELSNYFAAGFAPSTDQQKMWDKIQSGNATPGQTMAFTKEVVNLALDRADTANERFKTNMGYDDPNLITPQAKQSALHLDKTIAERVGHYGSGGQLGGHGRGQQGQQGPTPQDHYFSTSAWQQKHPGQDPAAAIENARSKGYEIK